MEKLAAAFPEFTADLLDGLNRLARCELMNQVQEALIVSVTFDNAADAGYIYLKTGRPLNVVEENVIGPRHGETLSVPCQHWAILDTDDCGRLTGIEILGPPASLKVQMRARARP